MIAVLAGRHDRPQRRRLPRHLGANRRQPGLPPRGSRARGRPPGWVARGRARRCERLRELHRLPAEPRGHAGLPRSGGALHRPRRPLPHDPPPARARRSVQAGRADGDPRNGLRAGQDESARTRSRGTPRRRAAGPIDVGGHPRPRCGRPSASRPLLRPHSARRAADAADDRGARRAARGAAALGRGGAATSRLRSGARRASTRSTPSWRRCRTRTRRSRRRASGCASRGACSRVCSPCRRARSRSRTCSRRTPSQCTSSRQGTVRRP